MIAVDDDLVVGDIGDGVEQAVVLFVLAAGAWRAAVVLSVGSGLLGIAAWALVGNTGLSRYPALLAVVAGSGHPAVGAGVMPNLRGLLACLLSESALSRGVALAGSLAVLAALAWTARQPQATVPARAGTAVVASDLDAFRRVLDGGRAGLLFPTGDAAALERALAGLLDDPARRAELVACARQVVTGYDWPVVARRVLEVYAAAIEATDGRVMDEERVAGP